VPNCLVVRDLVNAMTQSGDGKAMRSASGFVIATASLAAGVMFDAPPGHASGDASWWAAVSLGRGDALKLPESHARGVRGRT
jgi:hypothetical protein